MSSGGITYFVMGLIALGFFYLMFGVLVDEFVVEVNDQLADPDWHVSQQRTDAAGGVTLAWGVVPIILLIFMFLYGFVIAIRESDGNISQGW